MNRRSLGLTALVAGALLVGAIAGGAASVPSVYAKASVSEPEPSASQAPAQAPTQASEKKKAPVQCKTTKDCAKDQICTKVSDHKECMPSIIRPPVAPVVT